MLVIFDVDGTLIDSRRLIHAAQVATFEAHGMVPPSEAAVLSLVGISLGPTFERLVGKDGPVEAMVETYKNVFNGLLAGPDGREPLFPGVQDLLPKLAVRSDLLLGIASGKSRRGIDRVTAEHGWDSLFATIQTADGHPSKPHPSMLLAAMEEVGASPGETLFIGDTTYDVEMASAAGVRPIGVAWGYHPVADLIAAGAERILHRIEDLEALLPPVSAVPLARSA